MRAATPAAALALAWALAWGALPAVAGPDPGVGATGGPRLSVEPASFDFGRALPNRRLRQEFRLSNLGDRELVIGELSTDCGCAAALLAESERSLAPGQSATLVVSLATGVAPGRVERRVRIQSNDPGSETFELKLSVDVQPRKQKSRR